MNLQISLKLKFYRFFLTRKETVLYKEGARRVIVITVGGKWVNEQELNGK